MTYWALKSGDRQFAIFADVFVLGRGADSHLQLDDDRVSRRHAAFRAEQDRLVLEDLRSRNGTFVNGLPVRGSACLAAGDCIVVGAFRFELVDARLADCWGPERVTQPDSRKPHEPVEVDPMLRVLSPREREVFGLLAKGLSRREMAGHLGVSIKTLETHRTRIGQKLRLRNRAQLVHCALEAGVLRPFSDARDDAWYRGVPR